MALPHTITNGTPTNATEVQENFDYLIESPDMSIHTDVFGDGSNSVINSSANITLTRGQTYNYESFTLNEDDDLLTSGGDETMPVVIRVQGDCVIDGDIALQGLGANIQSHSMDEYLAGAFLSAGENGVSPQSNINGAGGGGSGTITSGTSGSGTSAGSAGTIKWGMQNNPLLCIPGMRGGNGGRWTTANPLRTGGAGGGAIVFYIGGDLIINGAVDVRGVNGQNSNSTSSGPSGGGGGGSAVFYVNGDIDISNSTLLVSGGEGGTDTSGNNRNGGNGGRGKIVFTRINTRE
jgi:hypothetical protein